MQIPFAIILLSQLQIEKAIGKRTITLLRKASTRNLTKKATFTVQETIHGHPVEFNSKENKLQDGQECMHLMNHYLTHQPDSTRLDEQVVDNNLHDHNTITDVTVIEPLINNAISTFVNANSICYNSAVAVANRKSDRKENHNITKKSLHKKPKTNDTFTLRETLHDHPVELNSQENKLQHGQECMHLMNHYLTHHPNDSTTLDEQVVDYNLHDHNTITDVTVIEPLTNNAISTFVNANSIRYTSAVAVANRKSNQ